MLKIERIASGNAVCKLSGRMCAENISEFEPLINAEASDQGEKVTTVKETSWQQQHNGLRT